VQEGGVLYSILRVECGRWCQKRCSGIKGRLQEWEGQFRCSKCDRSQPEQEMETNLDLGDGSQIEVVDNFCYLGDMLETGGGSNMAVRTRVKAAWKKWREIAGMLTHKGIPRAVRVRVYAACVRPVMFYGSETWAMRAEEVNLTERTEMRMLRRICGVTWEDRMSREELWKMTELSDTRTALERNRLRWYGHVERREEENILRRCLELKIEGRRPLGRPNKTWDSTVRDDLRKWGLNRDMTLDIRVWKDALNRPTA